MATTMGYETIDKTPTTPPYNLCNDSVGGLDGTSFNLYGYFYADCIVFVEV